jgi:hypothetical protein
MSLEDAAINISLMTVDCTVFHYVSLVHNATEILILAICTKLDNKRGSF